MKVSKVFGRKVKVVIPIIILATLHALCGVLTEGRFYPDEWFGTDVRLRRNEVCCAHKGVNSFRIWNRDCELEGFRPMFRPDKESGHGRPGDAVVHAYPPWHTSLLYFYGCMPNLMCMCFMSVVFGLCIYFIVSECRRICKTRIADYVIPFVFCITMIVANAVQCFFLLNYGVLILAAMLAMNKAIECKHDVCAGLLWAVAMIKPQVGLLFFWPLFWKKQHKAIIVATTTCIILTVITSFLVNESVTDLILQVPEIGKPYGTSVITERFLKPLFGSSVSTVVMILFFICAGVMTFIMKDKMDLLLLCGSVSVLIPVWTYSQGHDHVILMFWYLLLTLLINGNTKCKNTLLICLIGYCVGDVFTSSWSIAVGLDFFDPSGKGWIYRIVSFLMGMFNIAMLLLVLREMTSWPFKSNTISTCIRQ